MATTARLLSLGGRSRDGIDASEEAKQECRRILRGVFERIYTEISTSVSALHDSSSDHDGSSHSRSHGCTTADDSKDQMLKAIRRALKRSAVPAVKRDLPMIISAIAEDVCAIAEESAKAEAWSPSNYSSPNGGGVLLGIRRRRSTSACLYLPERISPSTAKRAFRVVLKPTTSVLKGTVYYSLDTTMLQSCDSPRLSDADLGIMASPARKGNNAAESQAPQTRVVCSVRRRYRDFMWLYAS